MATFEKKASRDSFPYTGLPIEESVVRLFAVDCELENRVILVKLVIASDERFCS